MSSQRVIKFRAWSKTDKKMLDRVLAGPGDPCSIVWDEGRKEWLNFDDACGVIMQFTGMTDKNKKDIYEGDIVKSTTIYNDTQYAQVLWDETKSLSSWDSSETWMLHFLSGVKGTLYPFCKYRNSDTIEVIGNIYENPELLEVKP